MKIVSIILFCIAFVIIISPPLFSENQVVQQRLNSNSAFGNNFSTQRVTAFLRYLGQSKSIQLYTGSERLSKYARLNQENREKFQACITACSDCLVECKSCAAVCLNDRNSKTMARCIRLNQDCAAICAVAMESMASGSEFTIRICNLCIDVCYACAIECERHTQKDHCTLCAEACRKCAIECIKLSKI